MSAKLVSTKGEVSKKGWRQTQSKIKRGKKVKLALLILALVVGLLVTSWTIRFVKLMFRPWSLASSTKNFIWNKDFNINLAVRAQKISLLSYSPKDEKIMIVNIPDETYLEVPGGFGFWQLRAVYDLGESQKGGVGGNELLKRTLTSSLAIPIDGFLDFSSPATASDLVEMVRKNPFGGFNILSTLKTDLSPWELLNLKLNLSAVRFDKIRKIDLEGLDVLDKENLLDGTEVLTADPVKLDSVLSNLTDPTIVKEHKSIAIFNATDKGGLAQKAARLITNLGGNVTVTSNASSKLPKTTVLGEESKTLEKLRQIFGFDDKISLPGEDMVSSRAQINIFLGEDYAAQ